MVGVQCSAGGNRVERDIKHQEVYAKEELGISTLRSVRREMVVVWGSLERRKGGGNVREGEGRHQT